MTATILRHPAHRRPQQDPRAIALLRARWRMIEGYWFPPDTPVSPRSDWRELLRHGYSLDGAYRRLMGGGEAA